jgi:2-haloacid dehalogenase
MNAVATVIAFDVNETLLDLGVLDASFEELLGSANWRGQWFAQMLQLSFVGGLTGEYVDFSTAQHAALMMVAERAGVSVTAQDASEMVGRMRSLPPHPEVAAALQALGGTDLRIVALTNSPLSVAEAQLQYAGIRRFFDTVLSADTVRSLKPAPAPYRSVAARYDVAIDAVRLVAAHSWDVSGALAAGCQAGFVARRGMVLSPIGPQPDIVGADIAEVVEQILARDQA